MVMKKFQVRGKHLLLGFAVLVCAFMLQQPASASPFGQGVFGANNAFGSLTSLSITLGSSVSMTLSLSGATFTGSGSSSVTTTTNDAAGYSLYTWGPGGTSMTLNGGGDTIPASSNTSAGALATNTWGYNTDGSSNYIGLTSTPVLVKTTSGPYESGDTTNFTYGVVTDTTTKSAGTYTVNVAYTVAALQD
jgi:hypothetical protein